MASPTPTPTSSNDIGDLDLRVARIRMSLARASLRLTRALDIRDRFERRLAVEEVQRDITQLLDSLEAAESRQVKVRTSAVLRDLRRRQMDRNERNARLRERQGA